MGDFVIKLEKISKQYRLGHMGYRSLREDIVNLFKKGSSDSKYLWALKDVSFELKKGEAVGIIGPNGAGKSTVLKILAGVTKPSSGTLITEGKIGALIELTAGFHPELTGRENIYLYGSIIGMKRSYIEKRFAEIVDFSGLEKFLDTPIKRYSSGMFARLGFSVSAHLDPDILLVDEVLSVGDYAFQEKCIHKMKEYMDSDKTIVYVSHNLDSIRKLCNRAIFFKQGQIAYDGEIEEAIRKYYEIISESQMKEKHEQTFKVIEKQLTNGSGQEVQIFEAGERAVFELKVACNAKAQNILFAMFVRHSEGMVVYDTNSELLTGKLFSCEIGQIIKTRFIFDINLLRGIYNLGFSIVRSIDGKPLEFLEYKNNAFIFSVKETTSQQGIADLRAVCDIQLKNL